MGNLMRTQRGEIG